MNIDYTLWPNADGTLGQNKVAIPDGVNTFWPEGDALVGNFVYKDGKLVGFVDTKALTVNNSKSTTFPYDYVNITVDGSLEGVMTFNRGERTKYLTVTYSSGNTDGGSFDYVIVDFTTADQTTIDAIRTAYKVVDKKIYDIDGNVIGTWDTSKLEVGGIYDEENEIFGGVYCNYDPSTCGGIGLIITEFTTDLSSLTNGEYMFYDCNYLTTFTSDLSSLSNGDRMFQMCTNLTTFTSDLSSLTSGDSMFYDCENLTTFTSDSSGSPVNLSSLTSGRSMFLDCHKLESFATDLSSLTNGEYMFVNCKNLTTFTSDLSSLTRGYYMFSSCANLTTFTSGSNGSPVNLSSLTNGSGMFEWCSNLTTFTSDLSSLERGNGMFYGCKLDTASIKNIAETINTVTNRPSIHIGIGNTTPTEEENTYFTQIYNKGWEVYVNGSSYYPSVESCGCGTCCASLTTLDENGEVTSTPIPFWAKPVPATEETAKYVDADGNFYNILGGQFIFVDDPDTYGMFINEEDAAVNMRLTKIGKEEIETA